MLSLSSPPQLWDSVFSLLWQAMVPIIFCPQTRHRNQLQIVGKLWAEEKIILICSHSLVRAWYVSELNTAALPVNSLRAKGACVDDLIFFFPFVFAF